MNEQKLAELLPIYGEMLFPMSGADKAFVELKGGFDKQVLILLCEGSDNAETDTLLQKMMGACQLQSHDYKVASAKPSGVLEAIQYYQPETVLLFGLPLESPVFDAQKEKYKPFRFAGRRFLLGDALTNISASAELKSALWVNGLKPLFDIA